MPTERTDRAWFSCLVCHLARKRNRSILTTPEPTWGTHNSDNFCTNRLAQQHKKCGTVMQWWRYGLRVPSGMQFNSKAAQNFFRKANLSLSSKFGTDQVTVSE